jgi:type II secretion system protein G
MNTNSKFQIANSKSQLVSKVFPLSPKVQGFTLSSKMQGFTLIELLITISIIGVISAISIFTLASSRESARNARRQADLESIRGALETYKADCNIYPAAVSNGVPNPLSGTCPTNITYMTTVPADPNSGSYYYRRITNTTYELCTRLEGSTASSICGSPSGSAACVGGNCNYRVQNP